jgi:hypothetical protein
MALPAPPPSLLRPYPLSAQQQLLDPSRCPSDHRRWRRAAARPVPLPSPFSAAPPLAPSLRPHLSLSRRRALLAAALPMSAEAACLPPWHSYLPTRQCTSVARRGWQSRALHSATPPSSLLHCRRWEQSSRSGGGLY